MNANTTEKTELNKILALVSEYASLSSTKEKLKSMRPLKALSEVKKQLTLTQECTKLLFEKGTPKIEAFPSLTDELERAQKGSALSCGELLSIAALLRSARIAHTSIINAEDEEIVEIKKYAEKIYFDVYLEEDISEKIINDSELSDHASEKLYTLRREIRLLNERIRARLSEYLTGDEGKYLQDSIVTMRSGRYVLPVKAEYKRSVKGFVHDRSATGATFFIEPEEVLEMNNELKSLEIDEREETERILKELSMRVGALYERLITNISMLETIDGYYARAEYGYKLSAVMPVVNDQGVVSFTEGRHPLIDRKKVVPVSLSLGKEYRFLLISGPNTGGKTVTLKMVGLFCLMAACGLFIPAKRAEIAVFEKIFCDIGDLQSIEEDLSTFSSHMKNVSSIVEQADEKTLVLLDELGGGTDPDEGQALAKAVVNFLLSTNCTGVLTTHYTALKEFAFEKEGIENACMEFDSDTLKPLYVIRIGLPGSSNALAISRRLGLKEEILQDALSNLSEGAQQFEHIVRSAEESRILAEETLKETNKLKYEWQEKLSELNREKEKLQKEREKLSTTAKAEARRIINDKTAEAEEILKEIEKIFAAETLTEGDLIKARTLKNQLKGKAYEEEESETAHIEYAPVNPDALLVGTKVFLKTTGGFGVVQSVRKEKKEAEILCGNIRIRSKFSELSIPIENGKQNPKQKKDERQKNVSVSKNLTPNRMPTLEVNVIGMTVLDAIPEVEAFLDAAVLSNLEEVRIVHGVGTGKLRAGIHEFLRTYPQAAEFRLGKYGEGETGVTIVKIK